MLDALITGKFVLTILPACLWKSLTYQVRLFCKTFFHLKACVLPQQHCGRTSWQTQWTWPSRGKVIRKGWRLYECYFWNKLQAYTWQKLFHAGSLTSLPLLIIFLGVLSVRLTLLKHLTELQFIVHLEIWNGLIFRYHSCCNDMKIDW